MKKWSCVFLSAILILLLLCACGGKGGSSAGYKAPEDAATAFVRAVVEQDESAFQKCVHPNMLEDWKDIWLRWDEPGGSIESLTVKGTVADKEHADYFDRYGMHVSEAKTVYVELCGFEYASEEDRSVIWDVGVICVNGRWYAWGWS